jgi:hypothetical protein
MGFWIVMVMLAVAIVCVIIAAAAEREPKRRRATDKIAFVMLGTTIGSIPLGPVIAERLSDEDRGSLASVDLSSEGATIEQVVRDQWPLAREHDPEIAAVWLGRTDLEAGTPLPSYERDLATLLAGLREIGSRVAVANLESARPADDTPSPAAEAEIARTIDHWNAAIARVCAAYGADLIDLSATTVPNANAVRGDDDPLGDSDVVAAAYRPIIEQQITLVRVGRVEDDQTTVSSESAAPTGAEPAGAATPDDALPEEATNAVERSESAST